MIKNVGNVYESTKVVLDGNSFERCKFKNCILEFGATAPVSLISNEISNCQWSFSGPAAMTINFLRSVSRDAGTELGSKLIQSLFDMPVFVVEADEKNLNVTSNVQATV